MWHSNDWIKPFLRHFTRCVDIPAMVDHWVIPLSGRTTPPI